MNISQEKFFLIGTALKIPKEKLEVFWKDLETSESTPFARYLFYFGALIIISAMTWFMNLGWEIFGGGGIFLIASTYALIFTLIGRFLWDKNGLKIPSGLFMTIAVCMVPLAVYGLETYFDLWPKSDQNRYHDFYYSINGKWVFMELATILAGLTALYFFPFPFLTVPILVSAWFLTMDIVPYFLGEDVAWKQKYWISVCFGILLMALGFYLDRRKKEDYAFWSYLFGVISFFGGVGCLVWDKGEGVLFLYFVINLIMMCFSILLRRNILMIFGALGVFGYFAHLAYKVFEDSILFPFVLSFVGLLIIYLGILYQKNLKWIEKNIFDILPKQIRNFLSF